MIDIIFIEVSFRASPPGINIPKEAIGTFLLCFTVWETAVTKVASSGKNSCLVPLARTQTWQSEILPILTIHNWWSGWWFGAFLIFHSIWDNPSRWFIFFKMVVAPPTSDVPWPLITVNRNKTNSLQICVYFVVHGHCVTKQDPGTKIAKL